MREEADEHELSVAAASYYVSQHPSASPACDLSLTQSRRNVLVARLPKEEEGGPTSAHKLILGTGISCIKQQLLPLRAHLHDSAF